MSFFKNPRIVGEQITQLEYQNQTAERGEPGYVMGRSDLMEFMENPHKWLKGTEEDSTESTEWGDLMDTLYLTPKYFDQLFVVRPETYPAEGMMCPKCQSVTDAKSCRKCGIDRVKVVEQKPWAAGATYCDEWYEKMTAAGKTVIKPHIFERATNARAAMTECGEVNELLECSKHQVMLSAQYHDPETGLVIPVKALLDFVPPVKHVRFGKSLGDLKTAVCCNPPVWEKAIFDRDYDAQAALYMDLYTEAIKEDRTDWLFVVQENKPPYEVANPIPLMSGDFLEIGRSKYRFALKFYARCLKLGKFPSYSTGTRIVENGKYILEPRDYMVLSAADRHPLPPLPPVEKAKSQQKDDGFIVP